MSNKGKVVFIFILIALLIGTVFIITNARTKNAVETAQLSVQLYGYRIDGHLLLQDSSGRLWDIPPIDNIDANSKILIDITGGHVDKVYVEVMNTITETEIQD